MSDIILPLTPMGPDQNVSSRNPKAWAAAKALEASFLSTMLQSAGLGAARDAFGGGAGEEQFSSMLAAEQARMMTDAGGIGLAESIYRSLINAGKVE